MSPPLSLAIVGAGIGGLAAAAALRRTGIDVQVFEQTAAWSTPGDAPTRLARCLDGVSCDGVAVAFRRYEATRKERTSRIQLTNRQNTWMRFKTDTDWVYGYDAWTVRPAPAAAVPA